MVRGLALGGFKVVLAVMAVVVLAAPLRAAERSWRPRGEEFQVNGRTDLDQFHPAVATNAEGRSFVVWSDAGQFRLSGRLLDASGHPLSQDLWINEDLSAPNQISFDPFTQARVAAGRDQFVVAWSSPTRGILIRRYDANGEPLSGPVSIRNEAGEHGLWPDIAFDAAGNFFVAWTAFGGSTAVPTLILVQKFDAAGHPLGGATRADQGATALKRFTRLAIDPASGGGVVVWIDEREPDNPDVWARRFAGSGQPLGSEFLVDADKNGEALGAVPVFHAGGGFSVVWSNGVPASLDVVAQRFDAAGARVGSAAILTHEATDLYPPAAAADPHGRILVLWPGTDRRSQDRAVLGRLFDGSLRPASPEFQVNTYVQWDQTEPAVAADGRGSFTAVWSSGEEQFPMTPQPVEWNGQDGSSYGVYGQRFAFAGCSAGGDRLCLAGDRFEVRVDWKDPFTGGTGIGHGHPLTADTGAFWFFGEDNLELMIKVLDARAVNGQFWVYYGALSNVEYTITVTDTETDREKTYHNPPFQFASRADVTAFEEAAPAGAAASATAAQTAVPPEIPLAAGACAISPQSLCLAGGRFAVEVAFTDPRTGISSQGGAVPLTADSGAFWFFAPANLELMIKVLDARTVNGRFWVFYGALSDVDYTITVRDLETGERRTYRNERGRLASRADVAAFPLPTVP